LSLRPRLRPPATSSSEDRCKTNLYARIHQSTEQVVEVHELDRRSALRKLARVAMTFDAGNHITKIAIRGFYACKRSPASFGCVRCCGPGTDRTPCLCVLPDAVLTPCDLKRQIWLTFGAFPVLCSSMRRTYLRQPSSTLVCTQVYD
jgi:hypothetical protein